VRWPTCAMLAGLLASLALPLGCRRAADGSEVMEREAARPAQPCDAASRAASADYLHRLTVDGTQREYRVHVPQGYAPPRAAPVVLNFHGGGGDAALQMRRSRLNAVSDSEGFLAVYPEGTPSRLGRTWNAGGCCGEARRENVDDVRFVAALLDDLASRYCTDARRVYATGMSNGAMLAYHLACDLSERIAAIAPVAGALVDESCNPSRPVAVLAFHGTADRVVPYGGGNALGTPVPSVARTIELWIARNRCPTTPSSVTPQGMVTCRTYGPCAQGTAVVQCTVEGGGHTWPGGAPPLLRGATTSDVSASAAIWEFFQAHPLP
jgi:polyhydroxybutyrate depolymerase